MATVKWEPRTEGWASACVRWLVCTSLYRITDARLLGVGAFAIAEPTLEVANTMTAMRYDVTARRGDVGAGGIVRFVGRTSRTSSSPHGLRNLLLSVHESLLFTVAYAGNPAA